MPKLGKIMTHLRLVMRMGRATGTDIVEAHNEGRLSQADWAAMVTTCRACESVGRCQHLLDEHDQLDGAPETCPNRTRLWALRQQQTEEE